jgi:hypothetical protein
MKHLFGEPLSSLSTQGKQKTEYANYELGLDYVQLLYQHPAQKLPILCLYQKRTIPVNPLLESSCGKCLAATVPS